MQVKTELPVSRLKTSMRAQTFNLEPQLPPQSMPKLSYKDSLTSESLLSSNSSQRPLLDKQQYCRVSQLLCR